MSTVMQISEESFIWSKASFGYGISVAIDISALLTSLVLFSRTRSLFYFFLAFISVSHICDMSFQNFGTTDSSTLESSASASSSVSLFFATIFAWINGCGFVTLNALKFYLVGRSYMRRLSFVLVFLAVFSVLLCSSNNIMYFYHYGKLFSGAEENFSFQSTCDRVFAGTLFSSISLKISLICFKK
ncbi:hypothetical protein HMI55_007148 [Coelomomyces lativittatus]|nr:hypothetical protein HMI55_007148 [Coelomomyces lativittatus]